MTRDEAIAEFRRLVSRYGIHWRADVPREAHERLAEVNRVLTTERDRREALGLQL